MLGPSGYHRHAHRHQHHLPPPASYTSRSHKTAARIRGGSPFGRSRHTTPQASQRKKAAAAASANGIATPGEFPGRPAAKQQPPPSPLDAGYQTLEHSYDGESSLSSLDGQPSAGGVRSRREERLWVSSSGIARAEDIPRSRTRDGQSQTALSRPARLEPGVSKNIR